MKTRLKFSKDDFVIKAFLSFPSLLVRFNRESLAAILLTLSQHNLLLSHHEILQCSPHNTVEPGKGGRGGEALCDDVNNGCMGD